MSKRWRWIIPLAGLVILVVAVIFMLNGWEPELPTQAKDGAAWGADWETLGSALGVEPPGEGFVLRDNNAILTANDTYLASWVSGSPTPYTNADDEEVDLYEAEINLLLQGCKDEENAQAAVAQWRAAEDGTYNVLETREEEHNGQNYTIIIYEVTSDTNPFDRGATAFATHGHYALTAELSCVEDYTGDPVTLLGKFLDGFHYSADI